jgi:hypothetical protein
VSSYPKRKERKRKKKHKQKKEKVRIGNDILSKAGWHDTSVKFLKGFSLEHGFDAQKANQDDNTCIPERGDER